MSEEIKNRVASSKLVTLDLEDYYPKEERVVIDISGWLYEGLILREKDFRDRVKNHSWIDFKDKYVVLTCSTEAIIPSWAYLLLTTALFPYAKKTIIGSLDLLENIIFQDIVNALPIEPFENKPVIVKGCSNVEIPQSAYIRLTERLMPVVSSLMFGEACSSVPLFKKRN